ncbi:hypothetical protein SAMN05216389_11565 [Oceanobacillus limi]|uniref:Uncharacterized protein n=1 Tax=Oceanobacillus limi TaxID=930131 RepID=A0A1I0FJY3_9BACI|nr:hypothetical protein [Oceanobacillus limi]SET57759.1 hypothetical protein SAMN05216389_11565 [Oceanobacillus limi]
MKKWFISILFIFILSTPLTSSTFSTEANKDQYKLFNSEEPDPWDEPGLFEESI